MGREPIPTWYFSLAVVRKGDHFLLVHERKHGQTWYLPAGRVEPGETLAAAAARETLEETSVPVTLDGILRVEHSPSPTGARLRVIFHATPKGNTPPKSQPDKESLEARWVTIAEMRNMNLRGREVLDLCEHVEKGGPIYPLSLVTWEDEPWGN
jgi:phosphatase NudJ